MENQQNTFHSLTASFIGAVISQLPHNISCERMQTWIENPRTLRRALNETLGTKFIIIDPDDSAKEKMHIRVIKHGNSPFNGQTAKFISCIVQNIPRVENNFMETWIHNPNTLANALRKMLSASIIQIHPEDVAGRKK